MFSYLLEENVSLEYYFLLLWLLLTVNRLVYVYQSYILLFFNTSDRILGKHFSLSLLSIYFLCYLSHWALSSFEGGQSHPIYLVCLSRAHSWRLMNVYSIVLLEPSTLFPIVLTSVVSALRILRSIVGSRHALFHFFILPPMLCIDLSVIQRSNCCINDKSFPRSSVWRGEIFRMGNSLWC